MIGYRFTRQRGTTMVEVLVTMIIVAFGLLGIAGLQMRLQLSEMESYQRSQALGLLEDIAHRIAVNRDNADDYVTGTASPLGTGVNCAGAVNADNGEWCNALQGAAERIGTSNTGAMIGARGCIESIATNQYMITVAWQGMTSTAAPPSSVACGFNQYNSAGPSCGDDSCRRTVTTVLNIATLN